MWYPQNISHLISQGESEQWSWLRKEAVNIIDRVPFITASANQFDREACERCPKGLCVLKTSQGQAAKPMLTVQQAGWCISKVSPCACACVNLINVHGARFGPS